MPPDPQTETATQPAAQPQIPPVSRETSAANGFQPPPGHEWLSALPDEALRVEPSLARYKGKDLAEVAPQLAKRIVDLQPLIGDKALRDDHNFAEAVKARLPASPEAYELPKPDLPEGVPYDEAGEKQFRQLAFEGGISAKHAGQLWKKIVDDRIGQIKQQKAEWDARIAESTQALRQELGQAYEPFIAGADSALKQYGGEDAFNVLMAAGIAHHPAIVKAWGNIGRELAGVGRLKDVEKSEALTPAQYDVRIREYRANYADALYDQRHPDHKMRVKELDAMYAAKHAD